MTIEIKVGIMKKEQLIAQKKKQITLEKKKATTAERNIAELLKKARQKEQYKGNSFLYNNYSASKREIIPSYSLIVFSLLSTSTLNSSTT